MGRFRVFSVAGIPVHFTFWYLLILLFWLQGGLEQGLIWGGAITLSILVHELGHAAVARYYRLSPWIEIHGWGGLCHHDRAPTAKASAKILIAGPGAGLALGVLSLGLLYGGLQPASTPRLFIFVSAMVYINLVWSLINLLPLWPLDGGQLFRLGLLRVMKPAKAEKATHWVGTVLAVGAVLVGLSVFQSRFFAIIAAFLAWQNISRLGDSGASGPIYADPRVLNENLKTLEASFQARNWAEASQLAHRIKADFELSPSQRDRVFEILGVTAVGLRDYEEAFAYLKALQSVKGQTFFAWVECVLEREDQLAAQGVLQHPEFGRLPQNVTKSLEEMARPAA